MADKPKRPIPPHFQHGPAKGAGHGGERKGLGWGGAAGGASVAPASIQNRAPFEAGNPGDPSRWPVTARRAMREAQHEEHMDRLHKIAMGQVPAEPVVVRAIEVFANRVKGSPVQMVVTPNDAPAWFVIEGQAEAVSDQAWEQQAKLAIAKPAGSAD